jgi:hypothetical protein
MWYNVHDVLNEVVVYIILNSIEKNNKFQIIFIFKMKHKIYKESIHFYKFILLKNDLKNLTYGSNFSHFS